MAAASRDLQIRSLTYFYSGKNICEDDLHTVIYTSCQHFTIVLMSASIEYVTDVKRINTIGEEQFLSLPLPLDSKAVKKNHAIVFIDNC